MSKVIIVHRWGADSESDWIPWLGEELKKRGVEVVTPDMPDTDTPTIETWVPYLSTISGSVDEDTYFVGHSIGCQTIIRYLATLPEGKRIGGVVFVAGFVTLKELANEEEENIAKPWTSIPVDWNGAASHTSSFTYIYSNDDPFVPVENAQIFKEKLNAKLVLDENRGHFTEGEDITELPVLLDELLAIMGLPVETTLI